MVELGIQLELSRGQRVISLQDLSPLFHSIETNPYTIVSFDGTTGMDICQERLKDFLASNNGTHPPAIFFGWGEVVGMPEEDFQRLGFIIVRDELHNEKSKAEGLSRVEENNKKLIILSADWVNFKRSEALLDFVLRWGIASFRLDPDSVPPPPPLDIEKFLGVDK